MFDLNTEPGRIRRVYNELIEKGYMVFEYQVNRDFCRMPLLSTRPKIKIHMKAVVLISDYSIEYDSRLVNKITIREHTGLTKIHEDVIKPEIHEITTLVFDKNSSKDTIVTLLNNDTPVKVLTELKSILISHMQDGMIEYENMYSYQKG